MIRRLLRAIGYVPVEPWFEMPGWFIPDCRPGQHTFFRSATCQCGREHLAEGSFVNIVRIEERQ